jgi:hypothetical protein
MAEPSQAQFHSPFDPDWAEEEEKPWVVARQRFRQIAIANSDAEASPSTEVAIAQT